MPRLPVTTRIIIFVVWDPYKPPFATVAVKGKCWVPLGRYPSSSSQNITPYCPKKKPLYSPYIGGICWYIYIYVRWTFTYYLNATFCLAIPEIQKKQKHQNIKNKTVCFSFKHFLNFAKENWWEESFLIF